MTIPTVHLNGTSRERLTQNYETALEAVQAAREALCAGAPNGRDYYPQGPDAFSAAQDEHYARLRKLQDIDDDLTAILVALFDGGAR